MAQRETERKATTREAWRYFDTANQYLGQGVHQPVSHCMLGRGAQLYIYIYICIYIYTCVCVFLNADLPTYLYMSVA